MLEHHDAKAVQFQAKVMYAFDSSCDVELTIKVGDIVAVTRDDVGAGWWEGGVQHLYTDYNVVLFLFRCIICIFTDGWKVIAFRCR